MQLRAQHRGALPMNAFTADGRVDAYNLYRYYFHSLCLLAKHRRSWSLQPSIRSIQVLWTKIRSPWTQETKMSGNCPDVVSHSPSDDFSHSCGSWCWSRCFCLYTESGQSDGLTVTVITSEELRGEYHGLAGGILFRLQ